MSKAWAIAKQRARAWRGWAWQSILAKHYAFKARRLRFWERVFS